VKRTVNVSVLIALVLVAVLSTLFFRRKPGYVAADRYAELRAHFGARASFFPAAIPQDATGVRIFAPGYGDRLPGPDEKIEVRMVIPPARASQVEADAIQRVVVMDPAVGYESILEHLHTADDDEWDTALPAGFRSYLLSNPSGMNIGGITINATSGEVIYWIFES
jgi:hypothetical protein